MKTLTKTILGIAAISIFGTILMIPSSMAVTDPFDTLATVMTGDTGMIGATGMAPVKIGDFGENVEVILSSHTPTHPDKIEICHKGKTISVSEKAQKGHLRHGDTLGPCP